MKSKIKISKPVIKDYENLVKEVSQIKGYLYHHASIMKTYTGAIRGIDKKITSILILGSRFHYRSPYTGERKWGDLYEVNSRNFVEKTSNVQSRVSNHFITLAYEAFEVFLRSITSRIIVNNRKIAEQIDEKLGFSSYRACFLFLQGQYRSNSNIISLLRKLSNELDQSFKKHRSMKNYINFYRVYSVCRNHIIHSDSTLNVSVFHKVEKVDEDFAIRYFGVKKNKKGDRYLIDVTNTYDEVLTTIVGFAYLIVSSFDSTSFK